MKGCDDKSNSPFLLESSTGPGQCPLPYINLLMDSPPFSLAAALPPLLHPGRSATIAGVISPPIG